MNLFQKILSKARNMMRIELIEKVSCTVLITFFIT